jgi:starch phosphorylase
MMDEPVNVREAGDPSPNEALAELALNLRWSWSHSDRELWGRLEPELWELTHNPWVVLQTVSRPKLRAALADPDFQQRLDEMLRAKREAQQAPRWFSKTYPESPLKSIAYFSMEYMLSEALPIYSGGLGNVAGDQLKAASDLGVPVVGVGLLYQQGYFRQEFDAGGAQIALYPDNDAGQLPIQPLRDSDGEWVRIAIAMPGMTLWIRAWQVEIGRTKLYLLDANDPANPPAYRSITGELYGGGPELRLRQEYILGLVGWRLLRTIGLDPEVCHLNEGHAAFAVLERARWFMRDTGQSFDVALAATRAGNVFTTHTAVEAGFDRFAPALIEKYLKVYAEKGLRISLSQLLALGRQNAADAAEPFNMANLAMRASGSVNGVSRLHGEVSRRLFQPLYPRWPQSEIPVAYVTNGVHVPTWESLHADALWGAACGADRWLGELECVEKEIREVNDARLWQFRAEGRRGLVEYTRKRLARQRAAEGASPDEVDEALRILDPGTLTLGFARRFATYKRPTLLLHDPERFARIVTNHERPVQLILAGKAHPQDLGGQAMVKQWNDFIRRPDIRSHVVFLSDYDMLMTQRLVEGVDVWVNTPRRPWEASGTSGMKLLVNGGLNLSELDGWWAEAYRPEIGWAIGDGREHGDDPAWDAAEAEQLYSTLERQVIPEFYTRDARGIPLGWLARIRESMACLTPRFSANRVVREYTTEHYLPAAETYRKRAEGAGKLAADLCAWRRAVEEHWAGIRFGAVSAERQGDELVFGVSVYLDSMPPDGVAVELYAEPRDGGGPERLPMRRGEALIGSPGGYRYSARVCSARPATDYTPRVVPFHRDAKVPLEAAEILWHQ